MYQFFAENGLNQIQKSYDELKNWLSAWREEADVDSFLVCKELQNGRSLSKGINIVQLVIKILLFGMTEINKKVNIFTPIFANFVTRKKKWI